MILALEAAISTVLQDSGVRTSHPPLIFRGICNILVLVLLRVYLGYNELQSLGLFRGYLRLFLFFFGVSLGLFSFLVKFKVLDFLKGLLKVSLVFWGVRVYLYYICILRILRFI